MPRLRSGTAHGPVVAIENLEPRQLLTTYYVATTGSPTNPGTLEQPLRTIQQAVNLTQPGDNVIVRGGVYRETVRPPRSGTEYAPITIRTFDDENVTVSGTILLKSWTRHENAASVYKASQSWDLGFGKNQVFVDGRMMTEARWPNTSLDVSRPTKATIDSASSTLDPVTLAATATINDSALTHPAGHWDGASIHFAPGQGWATQTGTVTSSSRGRLSIAYTQSGVQAPKSGNAYYLTGKFHALDAPGEWFRDPTTKQVYLWTPDSSNPTAHVVEAKRRQHAFDLRGRQYINVSGFRLFAATVVTSSRSRGIRLSRLYAEYVSHYTLQATGWDQPNEGIYLDGSDNSITDSVVAYSAGHGIVVFGTNSRVENNLVRDAAYNGGDSAGIRTAGSGHVVTGNTVYNTGRSGIKISNTRAVTVTHNEVHDAMLQTTDGGGIYTFNMDGTGSEIAWNRVYNVTTGGWGGVGIFLDSNSTNWSVHHNVVWNTTHALKMNYAARNNRVFNNTLAGITSSLDTSSNADFTGTVISNNIFTKRVRYGLGVTTSNNLSSGTDAKFVDALRYNFQLLATSPAVDRGLVIAPYTNNYTGRAPDLGALEYGRAAFAAGARLNLD